jgi:hypothetical protein
LFFWPHNPKSKETAEPAIQLPVVLAIGFTGHRSLPDESSSRTLIYNFLAEKKSSTPGIVYGISSLAVGGDLLFAESCIELGIPLRVLLPTPKDVFRKDFDDAAWTRAEMVMLKAISVEVVADDTSLEHRYYECGVVTVQQSQLLLALWNGEPAQGIGGTQEIVSFAQQIAKPIIWIHSVTGEIQIFNEEALHKNDPDAELDFLCHLPDAEVSLTSGSPLDIASAWLRKMDNNATRLAPQVLHLTAVPMLCTAAAALISSFASRSHVSPIWLPAGIVLGFISSFIPAALRLTQRQALWARARTAAEVSRSVLALWDTPSVWHVIGPEVMPELSEMLTSLNLLKILSTSADRAPIEKFKEQYLKDRLSHQIDYFSKHAALSAQESKRFRIVARASTTFAILFGCVTYFNGHLDWLFHGKPDGKWLTFASSILFQVATIASALLVAKDCDRRERRYKELHYSLRTWEGELKALRTWSLVVKVVYRIESALLVEVLEWKSLIRNRKIPRK